MEEPDESFWITPGNLEEISQFFKIEEKGKEWVFTLLDLDNPPVREEPEWHFITFSYDGSPENTKIFISGEEYKGKWRWRFKKWFRFITRRYSRMYGGNDDA